jgi:hypothetical protein
MKRIGIHEYSDVFMNTNNHVCLGSALTGAEPRVMSMLMSQPDYAQGSSSGLPPYESAIVSTLFIYRCRNGVPSNSPSFVSLVLRNKQRLLCKSSLRAPYQVCDTEDTFRIAQNRNLRQIEHSKMPSHRQKH